jgi:hypothetical protein
MQLKKKILHLSEHLLTPEGVYDYPYEDIDRANDDDGNGNVYKGLRFKVRLKPLKQSIGQK